MLAACVASPTLLGALALLACGGPQPQPAPEPAAVVPPEQAETAPAGPPPLPARTDFAVAESPSAAVVVGDALVWTDSTGALWTMSIAAASAVSGKPPVPTQLTDPQRDGFMFQPVVVAGQVFASTKRDFAAVALPRGPVTKLGLALAEVPEEVVADERAIYTTLFKRDEVMAIPAGGGRATSLFSFRRGVLAVHGPTLYAVSYATGVLVSIPTSGGKPTQIARGFVRPTALAADDTAAFVYTEKDKTLRRVDLATGATKVLAQNLENSDDLVSDGSWLYTFSWPRTLLRIAKDGSQTDVLADDLASPSHIAVDARAIYVASRDQRKIVRLAKR